MPTQTRERREPYELVKPDEGESFRINNYQDEPVTPPIPDKTPKTLVSSVATGFSDNLPAEARLEFQRVNYGRRCPHH